MGGSRDRRRARSSPHTVSAKKYESEEAKRKRKKHSQAKDARTQRLAKSFRRDVDVARSDRDPRRRKLGVAHPGARPVERRLERDAGLEARLGSATRADYNRQRDDMAAARSRYRSGSGADELEQETEAERRQRIKDMGPSRADLAKHDRADEEFKAAEAAQADQGEKWSAKGGRELGYVVNDKPRVPVRKPVKGLKLGGGAAPPRYLAGLRSDVPKQKAPAAPGPVRQTRHPRNIGAMSSAVPSPAVAHAKRVEEIKKRRAVKKALGGGQGTMRMGAAAGMPPAVQAAIDKRKGQLQHHQDLDERMQREIQTRNESLKRAANELGEQGKAQKVEKKGLEKMSDELGDLMGRQDALDQADAELTKKRHDRARLVGARDAYSAKAEEMRVAQRLKDLTLQKTNEAIARGRVEAVKRRQEQKRQIDAFNKAQDDALRDMQRVGDVEQVLNVPRAKAPVVGRRQLNKEAARRERMGTGGGLATETVVAPRAPVVAPVDEKEDLEEKASEPAARPRDLARIIESSKVKRGLVTNLKIHGKIRGLENNTLDLRRAKRQKKAIVPLPRNVPLPAATGTEFVGPRRPAPRRVVNPAANERADDDPVADAANRIRPPLGDLERIDRSLDDLANKLDDKRKDDTVIPENNPVDDNAFNYPAADIPEPGADEKVDEDQNENLNVPAVVPVVPPGPVPVKLTRTKNRRRIRRRVRKSPTPCRCRSQ